MARGFEEHVVTNRALSTFGDTATYPVLFGDKTVEIVIDGTSRIFHIEALAALVIAHRKEFPNVTPGGDQ
jgi:hypothetical protein